MKRFAPATGRNREPILAVLRDVLQLPCLVLEIASGTGQHAVYFSGALPGVTWQPSDPDAGSLASIEAWRAETGRENMLPPIMIDVTREEWGASRADAIVCINMIHISPWTACEGLMKGAARLLETGAPLFLYGPFRFDGVFTAPSNEAFDTILRSQDPAWGVRDLTDVTVLARLHGFEREAVVEMPANNHSIVFRRVRS